MRQIALEAHVLPYFAILSPWKLNIDLLEVCDSSFTSSWSQFWTHPVCLSAWNHALPCCNPTQQCCMYMQSHQIDTLLTGQGLWLLMRRNTMKRGSPCSKYLTFLFIMGHKSNDCYRLHDCSTKTPSILIFIQSVSLHCSCCACLLQHPDNCIQFSCISLPPW